MLIFQNEFIGIYLLFNPQAKSIRNIRNVHILIFPYIIIHAKGD